jgi:acyl carrier protein
MTNRDKLKKLLRDIFLLGETDFSWDLRQDDILSWDSLGTVSLAVGVQEVFGHHFAPEEAMGIKSFKDVVALLEKNGVRLGE